jgi:hypothetical protein
VQTDIQVEVINGDGAVVNQTTIQLSPLSRVAALVVPGVAGGYLRFTSNFPVHAMASIGTDDHEELDQIPAIRQ